MYFSNLTTSKGVHAKMIHNSSMRNRLFNLLEHVRRCLYKDNAQFAYFTSKSVYTKIIHKANVILSRQIIRFLDDKFRKQSAKTTSFSTNKLKSFYSDIALHSLFSP